jgi:hypothetical protein
MTYGAGAIAYNLDFNMASAPDHLLGIECVIAKTDLSFACASFESGFKIAYLFHRAHSPASAACNRFKHDCGVLIFARAFEFMEECLRLCQ